MNLKNLAKVTALSEELAALMKMEQTPEDRFQRERGTSTFNLKMSFKRHQDHSPNFVAEVEIPADRMRIIIRHRIDQVLIELGELGVIVNGDGLPIAPTKKRDNDDEEDL